MTEPALQATGLSKSFRLRGGRGNVPALRDVDLVVPAGDAVGLVGESGSGKSTFARIAAGLVVASSGRLRVSGKDVGGLTHARRRRLGVDVQMVFQDPRSSLNPRLTVLRSIAEPLAARGLPRARTDVLALLDRVGLPAMLADRHPHELSGGQCQRVAIARAIATSPALIVADEPVSSLDVSAQAQILNLLKDIQQQTTTAVLLISHDLGVVRFFCDQIYVLYVGQVVEHGRTDDVLALPRHPYTQALASAAPSLPLLEGPPRILLAGDPPRPEQLPSGCTFHTRCPVRIGPVCDDLEPPFHGTDTGSARCHLLDQTPVTSAR